MRILCLGDSIMQYNDFSTFPQTGWVQELERFFPRNVEFLNFARNGRSTKSYIEEGRFAKVLGIARRGDFALIQFGHNDEKSADPDRFTSPDKDADKSENKSFRANLEFFVDEFRKIGVRPILLTPVARRKFDGGVLVNSHGAYPQAIIETAKKCSVPCIDMTTLTSELLQTLGENETRRFYMNFDAGIYANFAGGKDDNSHLRPEGAYEVSSLAAEKIAGLGAEADDYKELSDAVLIGKKKAEADNDKEIDDEFVIFK